MRPLVVVRGRAGRPVVGHDMLPSLKINVPIPYQARVTGTSDSTSRAALRQFMSGKEPEDEQNKAED